MSATLRPGLRVEPPYPGRSGARTRGAVSSKAATTSGLSQRMLGAPPGETTGTPSAGP
jgi:hypothetical protein